MDLNKVKNESDNFYSFALFVLGWVILVLGGIGSIVLGSSTAEYYDEFNFVVFFVALISTAISGFLILGLAEIINILNDNRKLLTSIAQGGGVTSGDSQNTSTSLDQVPEIMAEQLPEN